MFKDPNDDSVGFVEQTQAIQEYNKRHGIGPRAHHGPFKGPRDWYISFGLIGGVMGLLRDGDLGAVIGAAVGVGLVGLWNLFWWGVARAIMFVIKLFRPDPVVVKRKTVNDGIDWKKYEREKKAREAAERKNGK